MDIKLSLTPSSPSARGRLGNPNRTVAIRVVTMIAVWLQPTTVKSHVGSKRAAQQPRSTAKSASVTGMSTTASADSKPS